ncbi:VOC family protein [Dongia mobilis]|jgi:catechol 2,3-dioxygenase-like lactoylglutathione lyase family enzyme|uniref:VOC family protein n=1 Tax=Dongia sp. TaxID=1977262 RepID=UPI0026EDB969
MIDHVSIGVSDLKKARDFYDVVFLALSYVRVHDVEIPGQGMVAHGYGEAGSQARFWIAVPDRIDAAANRAGGNHFAFQAKSRLEVDAFYLAAIRGGAKDNGAPGIRAHYHPNYYGAFAFDPDGNKIEACCHFPE